MTAIATRPEMESSELKNSMANLPSMAQNASELLGNPEQDGLELCRGSCIAEQAHQNRLTVLGELAACLAHELNQPLCAIVADTNAALNLLQSGSASNDTHDAIKCIWQQAQRAIEILIRIRRFAGRSAPNRTLFALSDCIGSAVALMRDMSKSLGVTIDFQCDSILSDVLIDSIQIEQVLVNLIHNALEAMVDTPHAERELSIYAKQNSDSIVIAIKDRGIGVPNGEEGRIFEKFHSTKPGDLGLGLSISRAIVELHGGRIWFKHNHGRGVTFYFTLPTGMKGTANGGSSDDTHRG